MILKIYCQAKTKIKAAPVKVRVIKAPLVDNKQLQTVIYQRTRAIVL